MIAPNVPAAESLDALAHVDCEQCGMCIDACPVGALTSGSYRYKTRPWEMNHVSTICTHCGDGCKTTLGVRTTADGTEIMRGDNRDKSGMNGDFLCVKGRYAFDFANAEGRITTPLLRQPDGTHKPATWEEALSFAGKRLREIRDTKGGKPSASLARTAPPTRNPTSSRSSPAPCSAPITSTTTAPPTTPLSTRSWLATPAVLPRRRTTRPPRPS